VNDLTKAMLAFCDPKQERYNLSLPFRAGRLVVATDGRGIIACKPSLYRGELADGDAKVPPTSPFLRFPPRIAWESCQPTPPECEACDGTGLVPRTCPRCDQAVPGIPCDECSVVALGRRLRWRFVARFRGLPDCEWGAPPIRDRTEPDPVWFRFDGGRGVLASMGRTDESQGR
jgi:hypothetical protein